MGTQLEPLNDGRQEQTALRANATATVAADAYAHNAPTSFEPSSSTASSYLPQLQISEGGGQGPGAASPEKIDLNLGAPPAGQELTINLTQNTNGSETITIGDTPNAPAAAAATAGSEAAATTPAAAATAGSEVAATTPAAAATAGSEATSMTPAPAASLLDAAATPSPDQSTQSPFQSLMNFFGQQDSTLASNPSDATSGVLSFMQQQDAQLMSYLGIGNSSLTNPGPGPIDFNPLPVSTTQPGSEAAASPIGTANIQPLPVGAEIQSIPVGATGTDSTTAAATTTTDATTQTTPGTNNAPGATAPTVGQALTDGAKNPLSLQGPVELGAALGAPPPPSPEAVGTALLDGAKNPLSLQGPIELGAALGLPQPVGPSTALDALKTGYTNPQAGLSELTGNSPLAKIPPFVPQPIAPATVVNDLKTGLSNPVQGAVDLSNDVAKSIETVFEPWNW